MNPLPAKTLDAQLVVFALDERRYALALDCVERVVRMVAMASFPKAPAIVSGVFDFHGELLPVINVRRRFGLPDRAPNVRDQLIVMHTARRKLAMVVDAVESVVTIPADQMTTPEAVVPGLEYVRGIVRLPAEGIIFVHDLDTFLSLEEEERITTASRDAHA